MSSRVYFFCLALLGLRDFLFGFRSFLFLFQRRQGQFFCWACGNLVLFGFRLFEKTIVELVALTFLFRVGHAHFFFGVGLSRHPFGVSQFLWGFTFF